MPLAHFFARAARTLPLAAAGLLLPALGWCWGSDGHQTVGAIADRLIAGTPAAAQVRKLLGGRTLRDAGPWADCARGVGGPPDFDYPDKGQHPACAVFEDAAGIERMRAFVRRNTDNCKRKASEGACHTHYHFVDLTPQRDHYDPHFTGARDVDLVAATSAAIRVLRGEKSPKPFAITSRTEALLLLAHYVGDLHQPLHIGNVYLDAKGKPLDVDPGPAPPGSTTYGGNAVVPVDAKTGKPMGKLHGLWDDIPGALMSGHVDADWLAKAKAEPVTAGDPADWPAVWAGGTLLASRQAYDKVRFAAKQQGSWNATLPLGYRDRMTALKREQITRAGARLAQVLQAVFP